MKNRKIWAAFVCFLAAAICATSANAATIKRAVSMEEIHGASCRILVIDSRTGCGASGSGTNVGVDANGNVVVNTNFHVVDGFDAARVDYFADYVPFSLNAKVDGVWYDRSQPFDFATLTIPASAFGDRIVYFLPLAPEDFSPRVGDPFVSSGCPGGRDASVLKCSVDSFYGNAGSVIQYKPAPIPGRSGSGAIFFIDGLPYWGGATTWRIAADGAPESQALGGVISVKNFYNAISGRRAAGFGDATPPNATELDGEKTSNYPSNAPPNANELVYRFDASDVGEPALAIPPGAVEIENPIAPVPWPFLDKAALVRFTKHDCEHCRESEASLGVWASKVAVRTVDASTESGAKSAEYWRVGGSYPTFVLLDLSGDQAREIARFVGYVATTENAVLQAIDEEIARRTPAPPPVDAATTKAVPNDAENLVSGNEGFVADGIDATLKPIENEEEAVSDVPAPIARVERCASDSVVGLFDSYRTRRDDDPKTTDDESPMPTDESRRVIGGGVANAVENAITKVVEEKIESFRPIFVSAVEKTTFWGAIYVATFYLSIRGVVLLIGAIFRRLPRVRLSFAPISQTATAKEVAQCDDKKKDDRE